MQRSFITLCLLHVSVKYFLNKRRWLWLVYYLFSIIVKRIQIYFYQSMIYDTFRCARKSEISRIHKNRFLSKYRNYSHRIIFEYLSYCGFFFYSMQVIYLFENWRSFIAGYDVINKTKVSKSDCSTRKRFASSFVI